MAISLHERLFRILLSSNHGFYSASEHVNAKGVIHVSYEKTPRSLVDIEPFFDLSPRNKIINFYTSPKSSITQREVSGLVNDLKKQKYRVEGEDFLARKFRKNEISLY